MDQQAPRYSNSQANNPDRNYITKVFINPDQKIYPQEVVDSYLQEHEVFIGPTKHTIPQPFIEWQDCAFPPAIMKRISLKGYTRPTPIQAQVLPIIMVGSDLIGIAQTGSGKTIAYLLPGLVHIDAQRKKGGPTMLILVPTRELAMQIFEYVKYFSDAYNMNSACIYGGADKRPQEMALARDPDIVVATPGRLIDFLEAGSTNLKNVTFLVLDEADRMLDMGFEVQVRRIESYIRNDRQTVFFSATWAKVVQQLACDLCHNEPINLYIGNQEVTVNKDIVQEIVCVHENEKLDELMNILDSLTIKDKVLIFVETKKDCEDLATELTNNKFFCMSLHGDKTQQQRNYVMREFKSSRCRILCATDVASRGLDVRDITMVVNYDLPTQIDNYVHRIGRTGRAGDKGHSVSLISYEQSDPKMIRQLIDLLKDSGQQPPEDLLEMAYPKNSGRKQNMNRRGKQRVPRQQQFQRPNDYFNQSQPVKEISRENNQLNRENQTNENVQQLGREPRENARDNFRNPNGDYGSNQQPYKKDFNQRFQNKDNNFSNNFNSPNNYNNQYNRSNANPNSKPYQRQGQQSNYSKGTQQQQPLKPQTQVKDEEPSFGFYNSNLK